MNNYHDISDELLARYLADTASAEEILEVKEWLSLSPENQKELQIFETIWQKSGSINFKTAEIDTDAAWNKVRLQITQNNKEINKESEQETIVKKLPVKGKSTFPFLIAAAVSLTLISIGWYLFKTELSTSNKIQVATKDNTKEATLPDGTKVFLNFNSSITYPENFTGDLRSVALQGEAFFDVKPDASHPFVIDANGTQIRVLGTSFNVKAYKKELVRVDVKTGKVQVSKADEKIELIKGESAEMENDTLRSLLADLNITSYKTQVYDFNATNLSEVISTLREGYHTDVRLSNPKLATCRLTISFSKEPLDATLSVIAETLNLHLRKDGKTYWLEGSGCQ